MSGEAREWTTNRRSYEALLIAVAAWLNVLLAFEPSSEIAAMHTTIMSASMTAYSTAVGPSSFRRKLVTLPTMCDSMETLPSGNYDGDRSSVGRTSALVKLWRVLGLSWCPCVGGARQGKFSLRLIFALVQKNGQLPMEPTAARITVRQAGAG